MRKLVLKEALEFSIDKAILGMVSGLPGRNARNAWVASNGITPEADPLIIGVKATWLSENV